MVQEHWTNFILTTPTPVFYSAHPTKDKRQNSNIIAQDLSSTIKQIGQSKISVIITDNASTMKKAWKIYMW